jgi:hypothetical protein
MNARQLQSRRRATAILLANTGRGDEIAALNAQPICVAPSVPGIKLEDIISSSVGKGLSPGLVRLRDMYLDKLQAWGKTLFGVGGHHLAIQNNGFGLTCAMILENFRLAMFYKSKEAVKSIVDGSLLAPVNARDYCKLAPIRVEGDGAISLRWLAIVEREIRMLALTGLYFSKHLYYTPGPEKKSEKYAKLRIRVFSSAQVGILIGLNHRTISSISLKCSHSQSCQCAPKKVKPTYGFNVRGNFLTKKVLPKRNIDLDDYGDDLEAQRDGILAALEGSFSSLTIVEADQWNEKPGRLNQIHITGVFATAHASKGARPEQESMTTDRPVAQGMYCWNKRFRRYEGPGAPGTKHFLKIHSGCLANHGVLKVLLQCDWSQSWSAICVLNITELEGKMATGYLAVQSFRESLTLIRPNEHLVYNFLQRFRRQKGCFSRLIEAMSSAIAPVDEHGHSLWLKRKHDNTTMDMVHDLVVPHMIIREERNHEMDDSKTLIVERELPISEALRAFFTLPNGFSLSAEEAESFSGDMRAAPSFHFPKLSPNDVQGHALFSEIGRTVLSPAFGGSLLEPELREKLVGSYADRGRGKGYVKITDKNFIVYVGYAVASQLHLSDITIREGRFFLHTDGYDREMLKLAVMSPQPLPWSHNRPFSLCKMSVWMWAFLWKSKIRPIEVHDHEDLEVESGQAVISILEMFDNIPNKNNLTKFVERLPSYSEVLRHVGGFVEAIAEDEEQRDDQPRDEPGIVVVHQGRHMLINDLIRACVGALIEMKETSICTVNLGSSTLFVQASRRVTAYITPCDFSGVFIPSSIKHEGDKAKDIFLRSFARRLPTLHSDFRPPWSML